MKFVFLACNTPDAVKGLMGGSDRRAAVEAIMDAVGGKLEGMVFTRGEFDIAATGSFPDRETGMGVVMALHASGSFSKISILEELDMPAVIANAQKVAKVYKPAG